jgi:cell division protein FtsL
MSAGPRKRRVRVITDKAKYRRHQRKKLARKLVKVALWGAALVVAILLIWLALDMLFRPRPLPQD